MLQANEWNEDGVLVMWYLNNIEDTFVTQLRQPSTWNKHNENWYAKNVREYCGFPFSMVPPCVQMQ